MKKKVFSVVLSMAMILTLLAGCDKKTGSVSDSATSNEPVNNGDLAELNIPDPVYYFSFDETDGTEGIVPAIQNMAAANIQERVDTNTDKKVKFLPGVKGDALYLDGTAGYKLTNVNGVGETYSISFWVYACRLATYMPTVQYGPDVSGGYTGNQHYVNITRAAWDHECFPCVWAYDQADDALWPWWQIEETNDHLKEWMNITLVVDPANVTQWSGKDCIAADLYINGELYERFDSDGVEIPVCIVNGTMSPSDNFDFLLGVNYWDSIFKGAFDELYIFDKALTAEEAKSLYASCNANAVFEEPERIITIKADEDAIDHLGTLDANNDFFTDWSEAYALKDGSTMEVKLFNWSDGKNDADNYAFVFANQASEAHKDPSKNAGYKEYAVVKANATGYYNGDATKTIANDAFTYNWANWNTWEQSVMVEASVKATISREGNVITIDADNVDWNSTSNTCKTTIKLDVADSDPVFFFLTNEKSYVDILSVKDRTVSAGITVGNTDCTTGWWTAFSDIWEVPAGSNKTVGFTNYTDGVNNWDNFVCILQSTPSGHSADTEGYSEYAVVRADNYGWGAGYEGYVTPECDWNWDTFKSDMDGAHVYLSVTNWGATASVEAQVVTTDGKIYTQKYGGIVTGEKLYFCLGCEAAYLQLDSYTVGNTDCTTGWWTQFSNIMQVPELTTKTVSFKNHTDGANNWDNFVVILQNTPAGHSAEAYEGYAEYAVVRADNYGWGAGYEGYVTPECDWNWDTFTSDMDNASVDVAVTNNGDTADVICTVTTEDGKVYTQKYEGIVTGGDLYFCLGCEASYLEIYGNTVGNTDCSTGWWTQFSPVIAVSEGRPESISFVNYTDGVNNWDNFVVILQNTPTGHSADTEGYAEYAVVRADNYGWGAGYEGKVTPESNWNWDTFTTDMDGARVNVTAVNNGTTADVYIYVTTTAGTTYTQKYEGIETGGGLYMCLGCEKAYLVLEETRSN